MKVFRLSSCNNVDFSCKYLSANKFFSLWPISNSLLTLSIRHPRPIGNIQKYFQIKKTMQKWRLTVCNFTWVCFHKSTNYFPLAFLPSKNNKVTANATVNDIINRMVLNELCSFSYLMALERNQLAKSSVVFVAQLCLSRLIVVCVNYETRLSIERAHNLTVFVVEIYILQVPSWAFFMEYFLHERIVNTVIIIHLRYDHYFDLTRSISCVCGKICLNRRLSRR